MTGIQVYLNNNLEELARHCCQSLRQTSRSSAQILAPEYIMVHSQGMARWLQCTIAKELGIAAHIKFLFPGQFLKHIQQHTAEESDPWNPDVLTWRILNFIQQGHFPEIKQYTQHHATGVKAFQLAKSLSETFDKYRLYRPQQVQEWLSGQHDKKTHWQIALFQQLAAETDPFLTQNALRESLNDAQQGLPERAYIFGMSSLAPYYLESLSLLTKNIDISLYSLSPSHLYIGDLVSKKYLHQLSDAGLVAAEQHYDIGNSLIAQCGMNACEFQILLDSAGANIHDIEWQDPNDKTLLQRMRQDMYYVREPGVDNAFHQLAADDRSIQFHNCHSPLRELETLRDFIIRSIKQDPSIQAGDIIVMSPKPELYAPYIDAVFNYMQDGNELPISFADQHHSKTQSLIDTFLACCACISGRLTVQEVLDLLQAPCIQERWGFAQDDLGALSSLINEAGILWGRDATHREELGLGHYDDFTWQRGLQRLLMSLLHGHDDGQIEPYRACLPLSNIENFDSSLVQKLIQICNALLTLHQRCSYTKHAAEWQTLLLKVLDFIAAENESSASGLEKLRTAITQTFNTIQTVNPDLELSSEMVLQHVHGLCQQQTDAMGFYDGRITFSGLKPMRSIPFKVICLIGMNENEFPRHNKEWDLDLYGTEERRIGDRDLNHEDRQLFLEVILSCKDILYVSYCGQNSKDQQQTPAAHLIEEFIDYAALSCGISREQYLAHSHAKHHLHPTHPSYTDPNNPLQTQSSLFFIDSTEPQKEHHFLSQALSYDTYRGDIDLETLTDFWQNPSAHFLQQQYAIHARLPRSQTQNNIEFLYDGLDKFIIRDQLFLADDTTHDNTAQRNAQADKTRARLHAQQRLPYGSFGDALFQENLLVIEQFQQQRNQIGHFQDLDISCAGRNITAIQIPMLNQHTALHIIPHAFSIKRRLPIWLTHVLLNCKQETTSSIYWYDKQNIKIEKWQALEDPQRILNALLDGFDEGQQRPLPFFPETSHSYAGSLFKQDDQQVALQKARQKWTDSFMGIPEAQQAHIRFCWPQATQAIQQTDFSHWAQGVWSAYFEAGGK